MSNSWHTVAKMLEETGLSKTQFYKIIKELNIISRKTKKGRVVYLQEDLNKIMEYLDEEDELLPLEQEQTTSELKQTVKELPKTKVKPIKTKEEIPEIIDFGGGLRIRLDNKSPDLVDDLMKCWRDFNDKSLQPYERKRARTKADNLTS